MDERTDDEGGGRLKDNIVRATRKVLGMTRVVFAEKAGLSLDVLNDVERRRPVGKETAEAVTAELSEGLRSRFAMRLAQVLDVNSFFDPSSTGGGFTARPESSHRLDRIEAVSKFLGSPPTRS